MRKLLFTLCCISSLHAIYTGNPASPALLNKGLFGAQSYLITVATGYIYDNVWNARIYRKNDPEASSIEKLEDCAIYSNWASLSFIFLRRLELYGYFGVSKESIDWTAKIPRTDTELKTRNHFSYSLGGKAIMLQFGGTVLSLDFQYFIMPTSNKFLQKVVNIYMPLELSSQNLDTKEWQLALGLATKLGPLCPYIGGKYSQLKINIKSEDLPTLLLQNKWPWGLFLGGSLSLSHSFYVNGEVRFFDEDAYSIAITTAF